MYKLFCNIETIISNNVDFEDYAKQLMREVYDKLLNAIEEANKHENNQDKRY